MSHLYCYRQKDICDSRIRKSVFSAESVQILVAVYIHLCHSLLLPWRILITLGTFYVFSQLTTSERLDITTILRVLQSWLYFISASCDVSVMSHYKIFFTKPTFTNRLVFDQTHFQELVPFIIFPIPETFHNYNGTSCIQLIVVCFLLLPTHVTCLW